MTSTMDHTHYTVFGASGLIGRAVTDRLRALGHDPATPDRSLSGIVASDLGHVFYCIGNDRFQDDPHGLIDAELSALTRILRGAWFDSFTYLSSTRLYLGASSTQEDIEIPVRWDDPARLFIAAKLTGEALCLSMSNENIRIVRLSNVFGSDPKPHNFLPVLVRDAVTRGKMDLSVAPDSEKDYIDAADVARLLPEIALRGKHRRYNLASGRNVSAKTIVDGIQALTGCGVHWKPDAPSIRFPAVDISRAQSEFGFEARRLEDALASLVAQVRTSCGC